MILYCKFAREMIKNVVCCELLDRFAGDDIPFSLAPVAST